MPRPPRLHAPGSLLHIIQRGNRRQRIFEDESDWLYFMDRMEADFVAAEVRLYAHCLMPNHFHLLVRLGDVPISIPMHDLLTAFAARSNRKYGRSGHVFQGRFKPFPCATDGRTKHLVRYIHMNPVRAGLVAEPGEWKWSSHGVYTGKEPAGPVDPSFVLGLFGSDPAAAQANYRAFMASADDWTPQERHAGGRRPLSEIADAIEAECGLPYGVIASTSLRRDVCRARARFINVALQSGYRPVEIARFLGRDQAAVSRARRYRGS